MRTRPDARDDGSMAVELVLLTPVLVAFLLLVVAFGRYVVVRGDVEAASRDAVRAASLERTPGDAERLAQQTAYWSLKEHADCEPAQLSGNFVAGGIVTATLVCQVPLNDLGLLGLPGHVLVRADSSAPLDLYRRTA